MNNEPVAWMACGVLFYFESYAEKMAKENNEKVIPLYTHPVKELTDEEIEKEALKDKYWDYEDFDFMKFAKAILRKAQEK